MLIDQLFTTVWDGFYLGKNPFALIFSTICYLAACSASQSGLFEISERKSYDTLTDIHERHLYGA